MANCPNCGQPTKRTQDWACQWCGYPLLSKSYRKVPKTYQQLKKERLSNQESQLKEEGVHEQVSHLKKDNKSTKIELTVEELFSICTSDQVEAAARFKNVILAVTGVVARVVVDNDGDIYYISLTGGQKREEYNVNCMFDKKNSSELNLLA
ncbi:MAG: OB-fold protein, partial [Candidatus Thorarchaeota archaeon]